MDATSQKKDRLAEALGDGLGAVSNAAATNPFTVLVVVAIVTASLGTGLLRVEFEENLLEILPRDHPDTLANLNLSEQFPGHHSYVNINFVIHSQKWEAGNAKLPNRVDPRLLHTKGPYSTETSDYWGKTNISDEVYLRGLEYYYQNYVRNPRYLPEGVEVFNVAWNAHVKLINHTNSFDPELCRDTSSGPSCLDETAYRFPCFGSEYTPQCAQQFATNWRTVYTAAPQETSTQASPDWDVTRSVYVYVPANGSDHALDYNEIGRLAKRAFLDYKAAAGSGEVEWDVFNLDKSGVTDAKIVADAHGSDLAAQDLGVLAPLVAAFILVALYLAFRSPKAILVAMASLVIGTVWTYGIMGYMGIALNTLNLTVVPLILGVGIDYSIHMTREYLEHRSRGITDSESFRLAGKRSGFAMLIATATTCAGLGVIAFSPSLLIAQMGLLSAIALACIFVLAMVFIPAALVVVRVRANATRYAPSTLMPVLGMAVSRRRGVAAGVIVVVTAILLWNSQSLFYEAFGNPALNYPEGDQIRDWYESGQASFFGTEERAFESNWVILEGDLTTPAAHRYIRALQERLRENPQIRDDSVTSIHNLVLQWEQLKRGTPAAVGVVGLGEIHKASGRSEFDPYPQTQEDIRRSLDEMYACECFRTYASLFINQEYDMTVILVDTKTGGTYEGAKLIITDVRATINDPEMRALQEAAGVRVALGGYTAFSVLFIETEMPWVTYMAAASGALVFLIVLLVWRDLKATVTITALVGLTSVWWIGTLPTLGVGLAVTLTLPLVFINCIGSDYGLHLVSAAKQEGSMRRVFENTGKAVLFSAVTTFGAFALFTPMTNLMMRRSMIATTVAILTIFVVTMIVIPLIYRVSAPDEERREEHVRLVPESPPNPSPAAPVEEDDVVYARGRIRP